MHSDVLQIFKRFRTILLASAATTEGLEERDEYCDYKREEV